MIIGQQYIYRYIFFSCSPSAREQSGVSLESFDSCVHVRCTGTALIMAIMLRNRVKASRIISADSPTYFSWQVQEPEFLHRPTFPSKQHRVESKVDWIRSMLNPESVLLLS